MRCLALLAAGCAAVASPLAAQAPVAAPDYAKDSTWLCLPARTDICSTPIPTTPLTPTGYGSPGKSDVAKDPPLDCFYVYPTVSRDQGMNSDLNPGGEERFAVQDQFARYAGVCRTYVPIYRQMTMAAVVAFSAGADVTGPEMLAYGDVAAAWRNYLATRNQGRPFVLIAHSQGSALLQQLISREIETNPGIAARMRLAIIPGFNVLVPPGRLVGGTFKRTPLCSHAGQTGCVMSWVSFREKNVPPVGALFGVADKPGMTVGCVNPALPGATGWVPLDSDWYTRSSRDVPGGPISWSSQGSPPTAYVRTQGLVSAKCITEGPRGYLWIRTNHQPGEKWTDRIGGEIAVMGMFLPGWGMHLNDLNEAQQDLVREVGAIAAAEANARSGTAARH